MKKYPAVQIAFLCFSLLSTFAVLAETISKPDYKVGKTLNGEVYKADKAACKSQSGNAKDVCIEEAIGKQKVARAELEFSYTGKAADQHKILVVKAKAAYEVAKEKCDDLARSAKTECVQEAKAIEQKALAAANLS